jgi:hypothetical protein
MALQWEPQWEEIVVEEAGVRLRVKRDRVTGLLMCPLCREDKPTYFFTLKDLVSHIVMHAQRDWQRERIVVTGEEEGEGGEEE